MSYGEVRELHDGFRLNIVDGEGRHQAVVSRNTYGAGANYDSSVSWSPDGKEILYFLGGSCGKMRIATVATGSERELDVPACHASWSPDGSRIAVVLKSQTSDTYLATVAPDGTDYQALVRKKGDFEVLYEAE